MSSCNAALLVRCGRPIRPLQHPDPAFVVGGHSGDVLELLGVLGAIIIKAVLDKLLAGVQGGNLLLHFVHGCRHTIDGINRPVEQPTAHSNGSGNGKLQQQANDRKWKVTCEVWHDYFRGRFHPQV